MSNTPRTDEVLIRIHKANQQLELVEEALSSERVLDQSHIMKTEAAVELWECTPVLRWKKNYIQSEGPDGSITRYGETIPTLQQLWSERFSGRTVWKNLPIEP